MFIKRKGEVRSVALTASAGVTVQCLSCSFVADVDQRFLSVSIETPSCHVMLYQRAPPCPLATLCTLLRNQKQTDEIFLCDGLRLCNSVYG